MMNTPDVTGGKSITVCLIMDYTLMWIQSPFTEMEQGNSSYILSLLFFSSGHKYKYNPGINTIQNEKRTSSTSLQR
jgi:hypothetical protein